jgi:serine/threonine protein kinase
MISRICYLVDYGLAKIYRNAREGHIINKSKKSPIGTKKYISINVAENGCPCRRDDLISICYVLFEFAIGDLPWSRENIRRSGENSKLSKAQLKKKMNEEMLKLKKQFREGNFFKAKIPSEMHYFNIHPKS